VVGSRVAATVVAGTVVGSADDDVVVADDVIVADDDVVGVGSAEMEELVGAPAVESAVG